MGERNQAGTLLVLDLLGSKGRRFRKTEEPLDFLSEIVRKKRSLTEVRESCYKGSDRGRVLAGLQGAG